MFRMMKQTTKCRDCEMYSGGGFERITSEEISGAIMCKIDTYNR